MPQPFLGTLTTLSPLEHGIHRRLRETAPSTFTQ
jgi:hypothetical protein